MSQDVHHEKDLAFKVVAFWGISVLHFCTISYYFIQKIRILKHLEVNVCPKFHGNSSSHTRGPHSEICGEVRDSPKSIGSIFSGLWISAHSFMATHLIVIEISQSGPKWWADIATLLEGLTLCCEWVASQLSDLSWPLPQVDLLRLRSKDKPQKAKVEQIVSQLEHAGQVTQLTLDDMLCYTPTGKRKPAPMVDQRRTSRRTLTPLQSTLLSEWGNLP